MSIMHIRLRTWLVYRHQIIHTKKPNVDQYTIYYSYQWLFDITDLILKPMGCRCLLNIIL